jgi:predicted nucleotidyltransferase
MLFDRGYPDLVTKRSRRVLGEQVVVRLIRVTIIFKMTFVESVSQEDIVRFCRRWKVRELALFGSALRTDFKPESDVDVLVSFHGSANWGLFDHVQMRLDLEAIFKRKVDLVTRRALEQSQNGLLRERILNTAKVIFAGDEAVHAPG